ncbi:MAG: hypothetical protein FWC40_10005 [Proteobacteria bacterium]|nr:hypothetical protein [Pseudomonadota bacterium]
MNKFLKLTMVAAMAMAVTACGDDKDNSTKCTNDAKRCSAGIPELCVKGEWKAQAACTDGKTCSNGDCVSSAACNNGDKQCAAGIPQLCEGGAWVNKDACTDGKTCSNGECVSGAACDNGTKQCAAGIPQLCTDGAWVNKDACTDGKTCSNGECVSGAACDNGTKQCAAGIPQLCTDGAWVDQTACETGKTCTGAGECTSNAVCTDEAKQCSVTGIPQVCEGGQWISKNACITGQACAGGECITLPVVGDSCDEATFVERCVGNTAYYCEEGKVGGWNCTPGDGICLVPEGKTAWCAYLDEDEWCDFDGEVIIWDLWACWAYELDGTIEFDSCHEIDGEMYIIEERWAESVCFEDDLKLHCSSEDDIEEVICTGICSFDGWNAMCK